MPTAFAPILQRAAARKGGRDALEATLPVAKSTEALAAIPDDRWLSEMARRVFQAGFNWSVIDKKWEGFEAAFDGFQPNRLAMMPDEGLDALLSDTRIVRHGAKIRSVRDNARLLADLAEVNGSAAKVFAEWPDSDYVGLLEFLKKRGSRLGGNTGQYFLRFMGKPSFVLSRDVVKALMDAGVVDKPPASKASLAAVQAAFDAWSAESGRDLSQISRILAMSVDA